MEVINYEFKAVAADIALLEARLQSLNPVFKGEDHQCDTYFNVAKGRLKLREGNIENALIYYERSDLADAKQSDVMLYEHAPSPSLKALLVKVHGVKVVVDKVRRIYYVDNVKLHFDSVAGLGSFVEVEAQANAAEANIADLKAQCDHFFQFFSLQASDYVHVSYSDLLLAKR